MLGLVEPTPYDWRFRLFGIPVRVHPFFWLMAALLSGADTDLRFVVIFVACVFVSIMVHEFGHGLMARALSLTAHEIVLYWMGGYCLSENDRHRPWSRLAVLAAGPGAGFVLCGLIILGYRLFLGVPITDAIAVCQIVFGVDNPASLSTRFYMLALPVKNTYSVMIFVNLLWGVANLLPILPLDGGQITEVLLTQQNPRQGIRRANIVSLLTAGSLAFVFFKSNQFVTGLWCALFAFRNYQVLQAFHQAARYEQDEDDADWWKR